LRNERRGKLDTFLRVRVPDADVLNRALEAAAGLLESLRRDR